MSLAENEQRTATPATASILPAGAMTPTRFSVAQFDAMIQGGIFPADSDRKMQLLRGEIVNMTPPNPQHDDVIGLLSAWAFDQIKGSTEPFEVRVQLSMDLVEQDSVVLPDLMLVKSKSYADRRPKASDTLLLIEVSDSSLTYDLGDKMRLYAEANVAEYWVIDMQHRSLIVHLDPAADRYRSVQTFDEHQQVESKVLGGVLLCVKELFR